MDRLPGSEKENPWSKPQTGRGALGIGGLAAILASICCLGPLVLVAIGISGALLRLPAHLPTRASLQAGGGLCRAAG